jgi:replicative DNA helicase
MSAQPPETRLSPGTSARTAEAQLYADSAGSAAGWDQPIPLSTTARPPAFPVQALPEWLAEFVQAEATATQTPPDLAGMLVLTALAAAAGGLAEVQVRPGWREPLNLFTVTALPPGNRKSAVFRDVARPLVNFDKDETDRMQAIILEAMTARRVAERQAEEATRQAGKANGGEAELAEAVAAQARAEAIVVPPTPRRLVDDATPEALASLLADHGKVALLSSEGGVFDMMAGRYQSAGGPNLDVYLKAHAGDPIRVDRKTARRTEYVAAPALTIGVTVQPEVLRACKDRPGFRGRGLLARFLYAVPYSIVGYRRVGAPPVPAPVADRYRRELQALAAPCCKRPRQPRWPAATSRSCSSSATRQQRRCWPSRRSWSLGWPPAAATWPMWPTGRASWPAPWPASPGCCIWPSTSTTDGDIRSSWPPCRTP